MEARPHALPQRSRLPPPMDHRCAGSGPKWSRATAALGDPAPAAAPRPAAATPPRTAAPPPRAAFRSPPARPTMAETYLAAPDAAVPRMSSINTYARTRAWPDGAPGSRPRTVHDAARPKAPSWRSAHPQHPGATRQSDARWSYGANSFGQQPHRADARPAAYAKLSGSANVVFGHAMPAPPPGADLLNGREHRKSGYAGHIPQRHVSGAHSFSPYGFETAALLKQQRETAAARTRPPFRSLGTATTEMDQPATFLRTADNDMHRPMVRRSGQGAASAAAVYAATMGARPATVSSGISGARVHTRGGQHIFGQTSDGVRRHATRHDWSSAECRGSALPMSPNRAGEARDEDSVCLPADPPPGYSGHMPSSKFTAGVPFGAMARESAWGRTWP